MLASDSLSSLKGKVAVLTGASRGIGKAIADALVKHGAYVVIGDILVAEGEQLVADYNANAGSKVAAFIRTDVTKYSDNQALFKLADAEFGGVDYALLNAGIGSNANSMFTEMDDELEERMIDINTTAVIKGTKVALLHMAKRGGGSIVHLASVAGFFSSPSLASYNASKHGVIGYTRSFQLMPRICNVRVNAICPYWVETDLISSVKQTGKEDDPYYNIIKNSPRTKVKTVVDGFLTLILDEARNTQTLMALPEGLEIMEPLVPLASFGNEKTAQLQEEYLKNAVQTAKAQLAAAMERYFLAKI
ncbi:hypothetical protein [Parasitella parasitica]|uniref:NAD(P)-binding protein n=1 Tax=Parasitella parasitica TaxID=35722 RepID=A0A0B7NL09_9FUNG|nr:hypothetical protein [Parasitella parasitica]